jgi:hypothetical protein
MAMPSRRSKPSEIRLPPGLSRESATLSSPVKDTLKSSDIPLAPPRGSSPAQGVSGAQPSQTQSHSLDPSESSPLSPGYVPPPGSKNSASPTTPITPNVIDGWPRSKLDALGLAGPFKAAFGVSEDKAVSKRYIARL